MDLNPWPRRERFYGASPILKSSDSSIKCPTLWGHSSQYLESAWLSPNVPQPLQVSLWDNSWRDVVKNWSRDHLTPTTLQNYVFKLKAKGTGSGKVKVPCCHHRPNWRRRQGREQCHLHLCGWRKMRPPPSVPSPTGTTAISVLSHTSLNLHPLDRLPMPRFPNLYWQDFMFLKLHRGWFLLLWHLIVIYSLL